MQHQRVIARDEWFPARRRHLSREITRRHDRLCAERRGHGAGADIDPSDSVLRQHRHEEPRTRISAA